MHPDHRRCGLGQHLLERTLEWARSAGATTVDAWTRDDTDTLAWYHALGFGESDHYLHVTPTTTPTRPSPSGPSRNDVPGSIPLWSSATLLRGRTGAEERVRPGQRRPAPCPTSLTGRGPAIPPGRGYSGTAAAWAVAALRVG
ncbi:GNAT family N-acetyltransferase [Streptomyces sp. NPDC052299]|uniref:GNAT family N-acetyltransferase n=1 Tax=Streptomyces sp. NPDC052299 TaxID=3155054 RepID=UPI003424EC90